VEDKEKSCKKRWSEIKNKERRGRGQKGIDLPTFYWCVPPEKKKEENEQKAAAQEKKMCFSRHLEKRKSDRLGRGKNGKKKGPRVTAKTGKTKVVDDLEWRGRLQGVRQEGRGGGEGGNVHYGRGGRESSVWGKKRGKGPGSRPWKCFSWGKKNQDRLCLLKQLIS